MFVCVCVYAIEIHMRAWILTKLGIRSGTTLPQVFTQFSDRSAMVRAGKGKNITSRVRSALREWDLKKIQFLPGTAPNFRGTLFYDIFCYEPSRVAKNSF